MADQPIPLDRAILLTLLRTRQGTALTVNHLWRRLTNAGGAGPSWREVASTVTRMERHGLLEIVGDELVGEDCRPQYALTGAGRALAHQTRQLRPTALEEFANGSA
ncbi:hypothetical protein [Halomonas koreensis]|uniref:PadR family transcriptional regulator n=1 Tax=Halomonas koreensis TaxID=245385 RepID=A0ABU1G423_9GAMM|nr:hypothetical protein [Halomonas koreensis]MDR5867278.1 hypothetical protein [Halomonas koreensis]